MKKKNHSDDEPLHHGTTPTKAARKGQTVSFGTKAALLVLLAVQNGLLTLLLRFSRVRATMPGAIGYAKTTLVVLVELTKIVVAFLFLMAELRGGVQAAAHHLTVATFSAPKEVLKLLVPSCLYVVQNNLVMVAAENLPGPAVAVLAQLKILTTALFSVTLLGKQLTPKHWCALVALVAGVSAVQCASAGGAPSGRSENMALGVLCSVAAAATSGFAGVYFEMVLKGSEVSVWVRNIHMAAFGVSAAAAAVLCQPGDLASVQAQGFFAGYDATVWAVVAVQAAGGLLVAAVVKFTDNILKAFATSAALVGVSVLSVLFFDFPASPLFAAGIATVLYAMFLYGDLVPAWLPGGHDTAAAAAARASGDEAGHRRAAGDEETGGLRGAATPCAGV